MVIKRVKTDGSAAMRGMFAIYIHTHTQTYTQTYITGGMVIKRVKTDGSAAMSGQILSGDRVLEIDGRSLDDVTDAMQLASLTHGEAGSSARLKVVRDDDRVFEVVIVRGMH